MAIVLRKRMMMINLSAYTPTRILPLAPQLFLTLPPFIICHPKLLKYPPTLGHFRFPSCLSTFMLPCLISAAFLKLLRDTQKVKSLILSYFLNTYFFGLVVGLFEYPDQKFFVLGFFLSLKF